MGRRSRWRARLGQSHSEGLSSQRAARHAPGSGGSGEVAAPAGFSCQAKVFGQSSGSGEQTWTVLPNDSKGGEKADVYWLFPPCTQLSQHTWEVRSFFPPVTGEESGAQGGNITCSGSHSI